MADLALGKAAVLLAILRYEKFTASAAALIRTNESGFPDDRQESARMFLGVGTEGKPSPPALSARRPPTILLFGAGIQAWRHRHEV